MTGPYNDRRREDHRLEALEDELKALKAEVRPLTRQFDTVTTELKVMGNAREEQSKADSASLHAKIDKLATELTTEIKEISKLLTNERVKNAGWAGMVGGLASIIIEALKGLFSKGS